MPKSPSQETPEEDHDLHGEWSPDAQRALDELNQLTILTISLEDIWAKQSEAERRFVAAMVFVPKHELVALRMEMRSRVEAADKLAKAARQA